MWKSPTGYNDQTSTWINEEDSYDNNILTGAFTNIPASSWSQFLELTIDALKTSKIRFYATQGPGQFVDKIDVDVWYDDAWHDVYEGSFIDKTWEEKSLGGTFTVIMARVRMYNTRTSGASGQIDEFQFNIASAVEAGEGDPMTEVLDALWELLESQPEITALVSTGNRIKLTDRTKKSDPEKDKYSTSDLPEITIEPGGGNMNVAATNTGARIVQRYEVGLVTGELRLHKVFFPLKWAVFKALVSIDNNLGLSYVRRILLEDVEDFRNIEKVPGWSAGFAIVVEMWFERALLKS